MFDRAYKNFLDAIDKGTVAPRLQKRLWRWWYQRLARNWKDGRYTFMNYGWLPINGDSPFPLSAEDEPDRCFIGLYRHLALHLAPSGKRVLEVGSGRGGGCSYLYRYHGPQEMVGVDYSGAAVKLSRRLHADLSGLKFIEGDAESLPFEDNSFDAVINVESSHCYGNMAAFLSEVRRVLRPGGRFGWADIRGKGMIEGTEAAFAGSGLELIHAEEITRNVVQAQKETDAHKQELINRLWIGKAIAREFSGTKGSAIHRTLKSGGAKYFCKVLRKP